MSYVSDGKLHHLRVTAVQSDIVYHSMELELTGSHSCTQSDIRLKARATTLPITDSTDWYQTNAFPSLLASFRNPLFQTISKLIDI